MKKPLLVFALSSSLFLQAAGQVPIMKYQARYASPIDNKLTEKLPDSAVIAQAAQANQTVNGAYAILINAFRFEYYKRKKAADSAYAKGLVLLQANIPADGSSLTNVFDSQRDNLRKKHESDLKNARSYRNEAEALQYLLRTTGNFNAFWQWRRGGFVNNANDAQMFYNQQISDSRAKLLNTTLLSFGTSGSTASIYNELFSDYFGPVRLGVGVLLTNQNSTSPPETSADTTNVQNSAVQKLLGGGGNGVLSASYPLLSIQDATNSFNVKAYLSPKAATDVPKIGTSSSTYAFNYDLGGEVGAYYSGVLNVITFYTHLRTGYVGGSKEFYSGLNKTDNKPFWLSQFSLGIAITNVFTLSWNSYFGDPFVLHHFSNTLSVSVSPN